VGEIPEVPENDLSKTGHALEDAKGQLEEVVELTERASMTIMDLADQIQADMDSLNRQMAALSSLESLLGAVEEAPKGGEDFRKKLEELKAAAEALPVDSPAGSPAPAAPKAPPAPPEPVVVFSLSTVFQTLYEFCTNESVKDHIKAMIQGCEEGAFNTEAVEAEMSQQAKTLPPDEGFYNYPIPALLKSLYANTQNEEFRTTLKKMNQTASSIFLDSTLMIEGTEETPEAPEAPVEVEVLEAAGEAAGESPAGEVKRLVEQLCAMPLPAASGGEAPGGDLASIPTADRETILKTVSASDALVKSTSKHLTQIMEALSFQDLSGQRIKKIVSLIGEIQVQLLTMLVSVNTKIKAHHESPAAPRPKEETEKVAQAEVDKMLERLSADPSELKGPGAEGRLDQGAVNDLLAQLGF
ncbi:MAG: protein phosphatase CheZ, partial [Deltaproteobacteria bacterium]|jgi:chemotaxis regulatin CheY-phosphate phosphatase CheZ|nr:protein phosphatase CheZ [Deltaproteobacteria bacterium]